MTYVPPGSVEEKSHDLVFFSGVVYFDYGTMEHDWVYEPVILSFDDLKWFHTDASHPKVQVAPVVSLGAISNIQTHDTETIGWGVNSVDAKLVPGLPGASWDKIQLTCSLAVEGLDTHLERLTYYVTAIGDLAKQT